MINFVQTYHRPNIRPDYLINLSAENHRIWKTVVKYYSKFYQHNVLNVLIQKNALA